MSPTALRHEVIGIGYEGRTIAEVVAELRARRVEVVVDVRLTPLSRKPGFSKRALAESLAAVGIRYLHLPALGNPKANRAGFSGDDSAWSEARMRYETRIDSGVEGGSALREIARLSETRLVAVLCFEADQRRCHRDIVLARLHAK